MKRHLHYLRFIALSILLFSATFRSSAQSVGYGRVEIGVGLGPLIFLGDLGGSAGIGTTFLKDVDLPMTRLCKGVYFSYQPTEWLGFRVAANLGVLEGSDAQAPNKGGDEVTRLQRNLSFRSKLAEAY